MSEQSIEIVLLLAANDTHVLGTLSQPSHILHKRDVLRISSALGWTTFCTFSLPQSINISVDITGTHLHCKHPRNEFFPRTNSLRTCGAIVCRRIISNGDNDLRCRPDIPLQTLIPTRDGKQSTVGRNQLELCGSCV
jgi:hypothetical protein